ncbi:MAG: ABC transporter ATP-binding protein/permease [Clostridiales bacterium]|nr:ABC transporter ATP-binding protein/permease [Clostridiales bacterium]
MKKNTKESLRAQINDTNAAVREKRRQRYASYRKKGSSEAGEKPSDFKGTLRRLLSLLAKHKFSVAAVLICAAAGTLMNVVSPDIMGDIISMFSDQLDVKLTGGTMDLGPIKLELLKVFGLYFGFAFLEFLQTFILVGVTQKLVCNLRESINVKLSRLPLSFFDRFTKGEILSKIVNDCENISSRLQSNFTSVLTSVIQVSAVLVIMFMRNWLLAIVTICLVPISYFITRAVAKRSKVLFREHWDMLGEMNGHIEEMYTGHNIVRIFGHEKEADEEFTDIAEGLYNVTWKANFVSGLAKPLLNFFSNINYVTICLLGALLITGRLAFGAEADIGLIIKFISFSGLFTGPINNIAATISTFQSTLASAERVFGVLDEPEAVPDSGDAELPAARGLVEFDHVSFRYLPDVPLIEDLDLTILPGQTAAIVGPTGAGKTTIVNLLMRFYDVTGGEIRLDGVNINDVPRGELRSRFGMVLQDTWLFKGTIRENIAYGRDGATEEEIVAAAKAAFIDEYIMSLKDGYDTVLEEDGTNLSQGQRQLLTIARAILCDPPLLILDEATSSVDTRTEAKIQTAMQTLMDGRTCFVIAHRLSTIKNADTIIVMRRGSIVEQGTHDELMAKDGFYAMLRNSQYQDGIPPEDIE